MKMQKIEFVLNTSLLAPASNQTLNTGLQICDQLIDINEVMRILNVKRTSLYKGIKSGVFPEPIRFSKRMVRWRLSDVMAVVMQSNPFIPNLPATNDSRIISHTSAATEDSKSTPHSITLPKSSHLEKLEERRRELLANAISPKSRAQLPIRRRTSKN